VALVIGSSCRLTQLISDVTPQHRLLGQSALQAFRSDIPLGGMEPTKEDQAAVLTATLLRQSLAIEDEAVIARVRDEALAIARESLGEEMLARGSTYDDFPARSTTDVVRLLAQRTDHAGRLALADHLLESVAEIEAKPLEAGRILSDRSRIGRKRGYIELAFEQNQKLLRDARRLKSPELMAKAHYGLAALAETRGNFVEFRSELQRAVRIARAARLKNLRAGCCSGLGTSDAMAGRYGEAVAHFWEAYRLSGGKGHIARVALGNLGQTLLISGRPAEARKVSALVIQDAPALVTMLPSVGTFAVASAQLGDQEAVHWACAQVRRVAKSRTHPREVAETLMECSAALAVIGETSQAGVMKRRAETMANQHGFHALTFQEAMSSIQRVSSTPRFPAAAVEATAAIVGMDVPRIPMISASLPE
jgi:tetratricopeptide (TPR) repeat protein